MQKNGFIKIILIIVIALAILSFFDIKITRIKSIFESSVFKENINYILEAIERAIKRAKDWL